MLLSASNFPRHLLDVVPTPVTRRIGSRLDRRIPGAVKMPWKDREVLRYALAYGMDDL
jgi:hypothetical protein